jgi:hypothetical protein
MSEIDTAAIVATVGTIAALVVIALFLRGCGRDKDIPTMNPGTGTALPKRIILTVTGQPSNVRWAKGNYLIADDCCAFDEPCEQCVKRIEKAHDAKRY